MSIGFYRNYRQSGRTVLHFPCMEGVVSMARQKRERTSALGTYLLGVLRQRNLSQEDLAERSGVGSARISAIVNDATYEPRLGTYVKIAEALNVPLRSLLEAAGYPIENATTEAARERRLLTVLEAAPWLAPVLDDLAQLPPEDQNSVVSFLHWHLDRRRQTNGSQSTRQES
jgi:transcriptional regulator with XRE-family HTH domain